MDVIKTILDPIGTPVLLGVFVFLFLVEKRFALRKRVTGQGRRWVVNGGLAAVGFFALRLAFIPAVLWLAAKNETDWHFGLLHLFRAPVWVEGAIAFLALDYVVYRWHILTHRVPFLWRFHLVHHTDRDMDVTTAIRFHFGEVLFSILFRGAGVVLAGASPVMVIVYEIVFEAANNFHHANWKLPVPLERLLGAVFVTPRMHGIHHSIMKDERNTNWGTVFSFWDRMHRTMLLHKPQHAVVIGEAEWQDDRKLSWWAMLTLPFRKTAATRADARG